MARRGKKPEPSHTPAHPSREPRGKGARSASPQPHAVPPSDDIRRRLAHLAEVERLAQIGTWEWDIVNDVVTWSAELYRILGVEPEECHATLAGALELAHPDDRARVRETIERAHRDRMPYECEHRIVRRSDGAIRVVRSRGVVVCDRQGRPVRMFGTAQDFTERRQVEATSTARDMSERRRNAEALARSEAQLRAFAGKLRSARESERTHIAREIHDELGQALTALKMDLFSLRQSVPEPPEPLLRKTDQMAGLIDQMVDKVRTLATELRPAVLDNLGLSAAVEWAVRQFAQRTGIECTLDLPPHLVGIDAERSTDAFRILQEALTNVARHARATRVDVHLRATPGELVLEVHDNGRGISDREVSDPRAFGLVGMRERVLTWGGEVGVRAAPQGGTSVTVCIPLGHGRPGAAA